MAADHGFAVYRGAAICDIEGGPLSGPESESADGAEPTICSASDKLARKQTRERAGRVESGPRHVVRTYAHSRQIILTRGQTDWGTSLSNGRRALALTSL